MFSIWMSDAQYQQRLDGVFHKKIGDFVYQGKESRWGILYHRFDLFGGRDPFDPAVLVPEFSGDFVSLVTWDTEVIETEKRNDGIYRYEDSVLYARKKLGKGGHHVVQKLSIVGLSVKGVKRIFVVFVSMRPDNFLA